jgi:hypothetical protein
MHNLLNRHTKDRASTISREEDERQMEEFRRRKLAFSAWHRRCREVD